MVRAQHESGQCCHSLEEGAAYEPGDKLYNRNNTKYKIG